MKLAYLAVMTLLAFTLGIFAMPAHAVQFNLTPLRDAYVRDDATTTNFGNDSALLVGCCGGLFGTAEGRSFLSFNTSGFPTANLTNVILVMTFNNTGTVVSFGSTTALKELLANFSEYAVTWNTQPSSNATLVIKTTQALTTGQTENWNSTAFTNYISANLGSIIDFGLFFNGGQFYTPYTSREGNPSFKPVLQLFYNGTAGEGEESSPAQINSVNFPAVVNIGDTASTTVSFTNIGNITATYKVGFSIGNSTIGFCNTNCYVGGSSTTDPNTNTVWYAIVTVAPSHTAVVSTPFRFRSDFFTSGNFYNVLVSIRPQNTFDILDNRTFNNAVLVVPNNTVAPAGAIARILNVTVSDRNPTILQQVTVNIIVTNNGTEAGDFFVGLSIGKSNTGFCNRNCYTDCTEIGVTCDYHRTGLLHVNQSVVVSRKFTFFEEFFTPELTYDVTAGVFNAPYLSPTQALHYVILPDFINISTFANKFNTYAINGVANPTTVFITNVSFGDDETTISAGIFNNNSLTYNYTIGMSIGKWDAVSGQVFRVNQPSLLPACNSACYTDGKGDFLFRIIPPNLTAPISRTFRVPHFFLENNSFDVAVAVYADTETERHLITIVYFKNVAMVGLRQPRVHLPDISQGISEGLGDLLGVSAALAKMMFAIILAVSIGGYLGIKTKDGLVAVVVMEMFLLGFSLIGWLPFVFLLIEGAIAAFLIASFISKLGRSGG